MSGKGVPNAGKAELRDKLAQSDEPRAELARRVQSAIQTMRETVNDDDGNYAEEPGTFDPLDTIVQERDAEGGLFIQTAGIHRADVLLALLELAEVEAGALWDEYDGPPEAEEQVTEVRVDTETACWQARKARNETTR